MWIHMRMSCGLNFTITTIYVYGWPIIAIYVRSLATAQAATTTHGRHQRHVHTHSHTHTHTDTHTHTRTQTHKGIRIHTHTHKGIDPPIYTHSLAAHTHTHLVSIAPINGLRLPHTPFSAA